MRFLNWLKSLFSKPAPVTPSAPVSSKGWDPYWTELLKRLCYSKINIFESASDILQIRPDFHKLNEDQKASVLAEFFKALAYYESAYNPKAQSVDVGIKGNKDTWSIGLLQLSVVDQPNFGLRLGYSFEDLIKPEPNLTLGVAIMARQVEKYGRFLIPLGGAGLYWATLHPRGRYDQSANIIKAVQSLKFSIPEKPPGIPAPLPEEPKSDIPWYEIAEKEIGVTELKNPKRVIEYHQATSLAAKDTQTPWCSSFVNWILKQAGYKRTNSAWARDWLDYGQKCSPKKGCILVFERGAPGGSSHVTFYTGKETESEYLCLGGNQGDAVCIKGYSKKDLLGCRWPIK
jgi:conserved hypothetical protein TIGR02594